MSAARRRDVAATAVTSGFFLIGVVSVLLGPVLPELTAGWGVTSSEAASLFVAQFAASSIGSVVSSFSLRRSLMAGYALVAVGLPLLAGGSWAVARPAMAIIGFGLGLVIPASNLWTAHRSPRRRGARLATLNLAWGLGAVTCPLLFAVTAGLLPARSVIALLAAPSVVAGVGVWLARRAGGPAVRRPPTAASRARAGAPGLLTLSMMAAMFFLYVGVENAVGGWLVTLADRLVEDRAVLSLLIGSGFWGAVLGGRTVAPWLLRRGSEAALFRASLVLAVAGTATLVLSTSPILVAAGALIAGLGMAPIFPLTVSTLAAATAGSRSRQSGWVLACGGLGGATLPWLTGWLSDGLGSLSQGFVVPLAGLLLLAALHTSLGASHAG